MSARRRPLGYFVHHQGRGHAERCAALVAALPADRAVTVFCADPDALPPLGPGAEVLAIPSLFEPSGAEADGFDHVPLPDTLHCAPLGWPGIRRAMRRMVQWFDEADPALIVCDVSAEVAQLARLCSVPHVKVLQHGVRDDPGHRAAYTGAVGLLAPFDRALAQPEWPGDLLGKACFAGGLGVRTALPGREEARERLGIGAEERVHLVVSGGGGEGFASAALGVAARTFPDVRWHTIGRVRGNHLAQLGVDLRQPLADRRLCIGLDLSVRHMREARAFGADHAIGHLEVVSPDPHRDGRTVVAVEMQHLRQVHAGVHGTVDHQPWQTG